RLGCRLRERTERQYRQHPLVTRGLSGRQQILIAEFHQGAEGARTVVRILLPARLGRGLPPRYDGRRIAGPVLLDLFEVSPILRLLSCILRLLRAWYLLGEGSRCRCQRCEGGQCDGGQTLEAQRVVRLA